VLPDPGQVGGPSRSNALSSLRLSEPTFQELDVRLRARTGVAYSFWIPGHPTQPQWCHIFAMSVAMPTHRSGA
jgi:hypothetical protein